MSMKIFASLATATLVSASGVATPPAPEYTTVEGKKIEVPAVPYCPDGSTYEPASGCAYVSYAEPKSECPHPYKYDHKSGACLTTTIGESSMICPKGAFMDGHKCVTEITTPVEISCTKGELTADGCIVRSEPVVVPADYTPVIMTCPRGYKLNGDMCVKEVTASADVACEEGFTLEGNRCVAYETTGKECPAGYSIAGNTCISVTVTTPEYNCPRKSFADKNGNCLTEVTTNPSQVCEKGYILNKRGKCEAQVLVTAVINDKKGATVVDVDCRIGTLDKNGNCYQTYTTDSVTVCDAGFELRGKKCVAYVPVEADVSCPRRHTLENGECVYTRTTDSKCPHGYSSSDKNTCVKKIRESPVYVCPKGFTPTSKHSKCSVLEVATPELSCRRGYEMTDGGECVIPEYVIAGKDKIYDINYSCPRGYTLDKEHLICIDTVVEDAQVVCEKGHTYHKHRCTATHSTPAQLMCPKGFQFADKGNNLCQKVSYDRPLFRCPEGAKDSGRRCYVYDSTPEPVVISTAIPSGKKLRRI